MNTCVRNLTRTIITNSYSSTRGPPTAAEREDIDRLQNWVEFFDVAFIPILVALAALAIGSVRLRRRQRRAETG